MPKPEFEFFDTAELDWTPTSIDGQFEKVLAYDDELQVGTRLLKFDPGCDTSPAGVLTHDFWEELYILEGWLHDLRLDQVFKKGSYACRPPGMEHGPWKAPDGCLTFEVRYYSR